MIIAYPEGSHPRTRDCRSVECTDSVVQLQDGCSALAGKRVGGLVPILALGGFIMVQIGCSQPPSDSPRALQMAEDAEHTEARVHSGESKGTRFAYVGAGVLRG